MKNQTWSEITEGNQTVELDTGSFAVIDGGGIISNAIKKIKETIQKYNGRPRA